MEQITIVPDRNREGEVLLDVIAVISFCAGFFAGGYCLGRLAAPPRTGIEIDPDPIREDAEVVSIEAVRRPLVEARKAS
jgi:hypothetical protein